MSDPSHLEPKPGGKAARLEIRFILYAVAAIIVAGGLYVLIAGSPTKNRAAIDSPNAPPGAFYSKVPPTSPAKPMNH